MSSVKHANWIACCLGKGELAPLGEDDVIELAARFNERSYAAGTRVFSLGQAPSRVYVVRRGAIELSRQLHGRRVALQVLRPGDVFGDVPLFTRVAEPFDATAIEDSVVLSIDAPGLVELLQRRPRLSRRWMLSVALRMAQMQARLVELLAGKIEAQVASLLLREADQARVGLSQAVLAELVGARRTSVNRVLKDLENQGLIKVGYRQVEILDVPALTALTGAVPG